MSSDAQIAREWASKALDNVFLNEVPIEGYRAAARHILATTTPPTMADVEWDDEVHAGLCAEHTEYGLVRMLRRSGDFIECFLNDVDTPWFSPADLTPIPGTRLDLAPRREAEPEPTPEPEQPQPEDVKPDPRPGEAWLVEYEGREYEAVYWYSPIYAHWAFVENREGLKTVESPEATPVSRLLEGGNHEPR